MWPVRPCPPRGLVPPRGTSCGLVPRAGRDRLPRGTRPRAPHGLVPPAASWPARPCPPRGLVPRARAALSPARPVPRAASSRPPRGRKSPRDRPPRGARPRGPRGLVPRAASSPARPRPSRGLVPCAGRDSPPRGTRNRGPCGLVPSAARSPRGLVPRTASSPARLVPRAGRDRPRAGRGLEAAPDGFVRRGLVPCEPRRSLFTAVAALSRRVLLRSPGGLPRSCVRGAPRVRPYRTAADAANAGVVRRMSHEWR